uniref:Cyclic nucleotide-binding domain-containing protein n=1 Tax=Arcella intermedia TaxID=1963864 RepID=A0A6B2KXN6_9EUKA
MLLLTKTAPLNKIFDSLQFVETFLYSYRIFTDSKELLQYLYEKYTKDDTGNIDAKYLLAPIRSKILQIMHLWALLYDGKDIFSNPEIFEMWKKCCIEMGIKVPTLKFKWEHLSEIPLKKSSEKVVIDSCPPPPTPSEQILSLDPEEVSQQITLIMESLISDIVPSELLFSEWDKKTTQVKVPTLMKAINFSNHLGGWVKAMILRYMNKEERVAILRSFIQVIINLRTINNFWGVTVILSCLQGSTLKKLKSTWKLIKLEESEELVRTELMVTNENRFKQYYETLSTITTSGEPYIPLINIPLSDVSKYNEVLSTWSEENSLINWIKIDKIYKIIKEFTIKRPKYTFKKNQYIQELILNGESWVNDRVCWGIAKLREEVPIQNTQEQVQDTTFIYELEQMNLAEKDWRVLAAVGGKTINFKKGETILREGDITPSIYRIESGEALLENGNLSRTIDQGSLFGFYLFDASGANFSVVAENDVTVTEIQILKINKAESKLSTKLYFTFARQLAQWIIKPKSIMRNFVSPPPENNDISEPEMKIREELKLSKETEILRVYKCNLKEGVMGVISTGTFVVTEHFFSFYGKTLALKKKLTINLDEVTGLKCSKKKKCVVIERGSNQYYITFFNTHQSAAFEFLNGVRSFWNKAQDPEEAHNEKSNSESDVESSNDKTKKSEKEMDTENEPSLSSHEHFLLGCETISFKAGQVISSEAEMKVGKIYYIEAGECLVVLSRDTIHGMINTEIIAKEDDILGHIDFLLMSPMDNLHMKSIKAISDGVIKVFEPHFLNIFFQHHPEFSGKFFLLLGQSLFKQLEAESKTK